jgi:hypothetical protein
MLSGTPYLGGMKSTSKRPLSSLEGLKTAMQIRRVQSLGHSKASFCLTQQRTRLLKDSC